MGRVSDTQRRPAPAASCSSPTHSSRCRPSDREQLGKAFQKVSFAKGDFIIKQGDKVMEPKDSN